MFGGPINEICNDVNDRCNRWANHDAGFIRLYCWNLSLRSPQAVLDTPFERTLAESIWCPEHTTYACAFGRPKNLEVVWSEAVATLRSRIKDYVAAKCGAPKLVGEFPCDGRRLKAPDEPNTTPSGGHSTKRTHKTKRRNITESATDTNTELVRKAYETTHDSQDTNRVTVFAAVTEALTPSKTALEASVAASKAGRAIPGEAVPDDAGSYFAKVLSSGLVRWAAYICVLAQMVALAKWLFLTVSMTMSNR